MDVSRHAENAGNVARWTALCPEKAAGSDNLTIFRLGGNEGTRCQLKDGTELMLLAEVPPATSHESVDAALHHLLHDDAVAAAKCLKHPSPLSIAALVRLHLEVSKIRLPKLLCTADIDRLSRRDRLRARLHGGMLLAVPFAVTKSVRPDMVKRYENGEEYMEQAHAAVCSVAGSIASPCLHGCRILGGGWMDLNTVLADAGGRSARCVVRVDTTPPFEVKILPAPPTDPNLTYAKVHGLGPDARHHSLLLALPKADAPCLEGVTESRTSCLAEMAQVPILSGAQKMSQRANVIRRCIERGRLFGGGGNRLRAAISDLLQEEMDSGEDGNPSRSGNTGLAFTTVLLAVMDAVRIFAPAEHCLSFPALVVYTILTSSNPSWQAPSALIEKLICTALAAQAADARRSRMHWWQWRRPATATSGDGNLEFDSGSVDSDVRNALRLLTWGFIPLQSSSMEMVLKYADVFVSRGGLPLFALPAPDVSREKVIDTDVDAAAIGIDAFPRLALYLQAALPKPPHCNSGDLKDNTVHNLRFFMEQSLYNIRDQKEAKLRGGYIDEMDMERIVGYLDSNHFSDGVDLAVDRSAGDDSELQGSNEEGFVAESECFVQSDRCAALRKALLEVQRFLLHGPEEIPRGNAPAYEARHVGKIWSETVVNKSAAVEGFLSLFGATLELCHTADAENSDNLRVTCANLEDPQSPLTVQKRKDAEVEIDDKSPYATTNVPQEVARATSAFCAAYPGTMQKLPVAPLGFCWRDGDCATLHVDAVNAPSHALRFRVGGREIPVFDASSLLQPCPVPTAVYDLNEDMHLIKLALCVEPCISQISLLWQLRRRAQELRTMKLPLCTTEVGLAVPDWIDAAWQSPISPIVWQEIYARMLLEECHDGKSCLSLVHAYPYQGVLLRVALILQLLYFDVLIPTCDELVFSICRSAPITAARHSHLMHTLQSVAFFADQGNENEYREKKHLLQTEVRTKPYDYQIDAVKRLVEGRNQGLHGSLDASSLGAGKTLVALHFCVVLAQAHGAGRFLILVGSESLMDGWKQQILEHISDASLLLQQENGVLRPLRNQKESSPMKRTTKQQASEAQVTFIVTTYSRAMRHPFSCTFLLIVADECLSLQNTQSLQSAAAWRLVTRSLYGGHFISGTMFRRRYADLVEMLKMLRSSLPLRPEYINAYFRVHLIMYSRQSKQWETRFEAMTIPESIRSQYLEVLDECRGRDARNYTQVLGRMRKVLNEALRNGRLLAERIWQVVQSLRNDGYKPLVFANTEHEAEALTHHIGCARRYRQDRHPENCPGCDICKGFNKFLVGCNESPIIPGSGDSNVEPLFIFCVGTDAQGLNLQGYGDALVLRPVQMDILMQMMGRLDRPGQLSAKLCRAIVYLERTHEEAEVAHINKFSTFWHLHLRPLARDIVESTVEASAQTGTSSISECFCRRSNESGTMPSESSYSTLHSMASSSAIPEVCLRQFASNAMCKPVGNDGSSKKYFRHRNLHIPRISQGSTSINKEECPIPPRRMTHESIRDGLAFLVRHDPPFRHILQIIGPPTMLLSLIGKDLPDAFTTLAQTICHQQLSLKVCQSMFQRLLDMCGNRDLKTLDPQRVVDAKPESIRETAQLSFRKISYIQKLAERFLNGELSSAFFSEASDEKVRETLNSLVGIGEWTTEMFLIFQLQRHGAVIYGDVAFQKALRMVYDLRAPHDVTKYCEVSWSPTREQMQECVRRWGPYSSIAALYMLRIADNENSAFVLPDVECEADAVEAVIDIEDEADLPCEAPQKRKRTCGDAARGHKQSPKAAKFSVDLNVAVLDDSCKPRAFGKLSQSSDTVLDIA